MKQRGKRKQDRKHEFYYKKAKAEGYKARSAYKLIQMDEKFNLFRKNQVIVDLCGAPGGFSQYIKRKLGNDCYIVLADIEKVDAMKGIDCLQLDITTEDSVAIIKETIARSHPNNKRVDIVIADCSPKVIGSWSTDHARQIYLSENAFQIARGLSARMFVTKVFQGELLEDFITEVKKVYRSVKLHKPKASRKTSAEIYLLARGMRNPVHE
ncbi:MAG: SAM-dependent methyltransferase [Candidatus Hodarchaeales archaeon]